MITECLILLFFQPALAFWDYGTTTEGFTRTDVGPRTSFFRWQRVEFEGMRFWHPEWWNNNDMTNRRFLCCVAGISIDFKNLGTAVILNRRTLITSGNYLEPYNHRQRDVRIWALGRAGLNDTPYRYRVWRWRRLLPRSNNPEHWHGPRGIHVPRHDVVVMHARDQIYIYYYMPNRWMYAYRGFLSQKRQEILDEFLFVGSGYEYLTHVLDNYKIFFATGLKENIVNCEQYLPKWWGKFICIKNTKKFAGVPNGGGLFTNYLLIGLGCFEIRYNEDRIMVFTDLRYYNDWIYIFANITYGSYYEYAYPQWISMLGIYNREVTTPYMADWQHMNDLFPLG